MAGLDDLYENRPTGLEVPTQGSSEIRATKAKVKEFASIEHAYNGRHKFPTVSILPANDSNSRRIVIKITVGMPDELYYDNGATWIKITTNSEIADIIADLLAHQISSPIDHADGSITTAKLNDDCVTADKIGNGAVLGHHLNAADSVNPEYSVAPLVNGSDLDATWHTHSQYSANSGIQFLSSALLVGSGTGDIAWTTIDANTLSGGVIPVTAKALLLIINISLINTGLGSAETGVAVYGRKAVGSPSITLVQQVVPTPVTANSLLSVQAFCPMTGTDGKFDFSVTGTSAFIGTWEILLFGYYV